MSIIRFDPYRRPGGAGSWFNARNARNAVNAGKKIGAVGKKFLAARKTKGTPINVSHTTTKQKSTTGRGYKKVHKDKVTSKHARKAIASVVKTELNKEIELKRPTPNSIDLGATIPHRAVYVMDLAAQLGRGTDVGNYSGDKVHLTSVNLRGWIYEQIGPRKNLPQALEFYLIEKKGGFQSPTVPVFGNGLWKQISEDQFTTVNFGEDQNQFEGRFAKVAPQKNRFRIMSKKVFRPPVNNIALDAPHATLAIDYRFKIDKTVKPFGAMSGDEVTDLPRVYLVMRAFTIPYHEYGTVGAAQGNLETQLYFRDA